MKKRILSILLAVVMIVPMFAMPMSVSATASGEYSYAFEANDFRNFVDGQVVDLGKEGEVATAPVVDGAISSGEYNGSTVMKRSGAKDGAPETIDVYTAVKDGYLYVALDTGDSTRVGIQYNIGVHQWHYSDGAYSRVQAIWKADGGIGFGQLIKYPQTGVAGTKWADKGTSWTSGDSKKPEAFIVDKAYANGVYEAKFNIYSFYRYFANTVRGEGIYETPCMTFFFFYDLGGSSQIDYYAENGVGVSCKIDSQVNATMLPITIIIPETTRAAVAAKRGVIGDLGEDWRNAVDGQLSRIPTYATGDSTVDGKVDTNDNYTTTHSFVDSANRNITLSSAITEDGSIYIAWKFPSANAVDSTGVNKRVQFEFGLCGNSSAMNGASRFSAHIYGDGTFGFNHYEIRMSNAETTCVNLFGAADKTTATTYAKEVFPLVASGRVNDGEYTTIEAKIEIAPLIAAYSEGGWDMQDLNCLSFMLWDSVSFVSFDVSTAQQNELFKNSVVNKTYTTVYPTVELPAGAIERFMIDDVDDLEVYGQHHLESVKTNVNLDGIISEGEYGSKYDYTTTVLAANGISGTNYFSGNDEYIYIGATVKDPTYVVGKAMYQWDLSVIPHDGIFDTSETVRRLSGYVRLNSDGTVYVETPGTVWRSQTGTAGGNAEEVAAKARIAEIVAGGLSNFIEAKASYDEATQTVTYEIALKKSAIKYFYNFDENYDLERFTYFNYITTGYNAETNKNTIGEFHYFFDTSKVYATMLGLTRSAFGGTLAYNSVMPGAAVVDLVEGFTTKKTASVRISAEASGLRFKTTYSNDYLAEMKAYAESMGKTMEIGTLIAPADFVTGEFTHAALGTGNYIEVMANVATPFDNTNGVTTIAGSIVNIKAANLERDFAGTGFIRIGDEVFYSDTYSVRNVAEIATAALADTAAAYTPGQILILQKLNGTAAN